MDQTGDTLDVFSLYYLSRRKGPTTTEPSRLPAESRGNVSINTQSSSIYIQIYISGIYIYVYIKRKRKTKYTYNTFVLLWRIPQRSPGKRRRRRYGEKIRVLSPDSINPTAAAAAAATCTTDKGPRKCVFGEPQQQSIIEHYALEGDGITRLHILKESYRLSSALLHPERNKRVSLSL